LPAVFIIALTVEPTPGSPLDVHAADSNIGIHLCLIAGSLKKSNTSCGERLIKTLAVNLPIVDSPFLALINYGDYLSVVMGQQWNGLTGGWRLCS
jgi:hypothetical protein